MKKLSVLALFLVVLSACTFVKPPTVKGIQSRLVQTRPHFDGQLNLEDVKPGEFLYEVGMGYTYEVLVLSTPYTIDGICYFDSVWWRNEKPGEFIQQNYCSDYGLVKYANEFHGWNPYNHLVISYRNPFTQDQLDELKSTLILEPGYRTVTSINP